MKYTNACKIISRIYLKSKSAFTDLISGPLQSFQVYEKQHSWDISYLLLIELWDKYFYNILSDVKKYIYVF
jgi:hypothetical protein